MSEHTPTPWEANSRCFGGGDAGANISIWSDRSLVATAATIHEGTINAEANAAYIVMACNCHDDLLAVCKEVECWVVLATGRDAHPASVDFARKDLAALRAAIAKTTLTVPNPEERPCPTKS